MDYTFSLRGVFATVRAMLSSRYRDAEALRQVEAEKPHKHAGADSTPRAARPTLQGTEIAAKRETGRRHRAGVRLSRRRDSQLKSGDKLEGYIFDRGSSKIRILLKSASKKVTVPVNDIEQLSFTGRDMADGRSWEAWVKKYAERKAAGESNIELAAGSDRIGFRYERGEPGLYGAC